MNKFLSIKEIMTANPTFVNTNTNISEMIDKMEKFGFDHFPVVDDSLHLKGIVTKTDLYEKVLSLSRSTSGRTYSEKQINNTLASDVMTADPTSIDINEHLEAVLELFYKEDFHALPVLENKRLVGIITCKDVLGAINDMQFSRA